MRRSRGKGIRTDLCAEAIRLTRILATLMPDEPEVHGLLALMLLTDARRPSRVADGALVALPDQDRTSWDADLIAEGHDIVRALPAPRSARPLPDPGGDQRGAHRCQQRRADGLAADRRAVRPAVRRRSHPGRRAQSRRSRSPRWTGRQAALDILDALHLADYHAYQADPGGPAPPSGRHHRGGSGLPAGDRTGEQPGRAGVPPRPARRSG